MSTRENTIGDLRAHLFETLAALRDKQDPMDIERAKTVCLVAKGITDIARTEIDYQRVTGTEISSDFFLPTPPVLSGTPAPKITTRTTGAGGHLTCETIQGGSITRHKLP